MKKKLLLALCALLILCLAAACGQGTPAIRYGEPGRTVIIDPWESVSVTLTEEELAAVLGNEPPEWEDYRLEGTVRVFLGSGYELNRESWHLHISGIRTGDPTGKERFDLYLSPGKMPPGKLGEQTDGVSNLLWGVEVDACRWMWDEPLEKLQLRFLTEKTGVHFQILSADRPAAESLAAETAQWIIRDGGLALSGFPIPWERMEQVYQDQWGHVISTRD